MIQSRMSLHDSLDRHVPQLRNRLGKWMSAPQGQDQAQQFFLHFAALQRHGSTNIPGAFGLGTETAY